MPSQDATEHQHRTPDGPAIDRARTASTYQVDRSELAGLARFRSCPNPAGRDPADGRLPRRSHFGVGRRVWRRRVRSTTRPATDRRSWGRTSRHRLGRQGGGAGGGSRRAPAPDARPGVASMCPATALVDRQVGCGEVAIDVEHIHPDRSYVRRSRTRRRCCHHTRVEADNHADAPRPESKHEERCGRTPLRPLLERAPELHRVASVSQPRSEGMIRNGRSWPTPSRLRTEALEAGAVPSGWRSPERAMVSAIPSGHGGFRRGTRRLAVRRDRAAG